MAALNWNDLSETPPKAINWDDLSDTPPKETSVLERVVNTGQALGRLAKDLPTHAAGYVANIKEGSRPLDKTDWADKATEDSSNVLNERLSAPDVNDKTLLGTKGDWAQTGGSIPFSAGSIGGALVGGGLATLASKNPIVGYGVGASASGALAYRADSAMFMNSALNTFKDKYKAENNGEEPSQELMLAEQERLQPYAKDHGLWEAIPEGLGSAIGGKVISSAFKNASENIAVRAGKAIAGIAAEELPSETVTQIGQHNTEINAGVSDGDKRSFTSPSDIATSVGEVAIPVAQQSLLMGGSTGITGKAFDYAKERAKKLQETASTGAIGGAIAASGITNTDIAIQPDSEEKKAESNQSAQIEKSYSEPTFDKPHSPYDDLFDSATDKHNLPDGLLHKMGQIESGFNPEVTSPKGARGIMQFMPRTAIEYGINPNDTPVAIDAAGQKMAHLRDYYDGDITKAIAAYNYGEGNLDKVINEHGDNWREHLPTETTNYLSKIIGGNSESKSGRMDDRGSIDATDNTGNAELPSDNNSISTDNTLVDNSGNEEDVTQTNKTKEERKNNSRFLGSKEFSIDSEDDGEFDAKVHRLKNGGALITDSNGGLYEHHPDFVKGMNDDDLLKFQYESLGFKSATEKSAEPKKPDLNTEIKESGKEPVKSTDSKPIINDDGKAIADQITPIQPKPANNKKVEVKYNGKRFHVLQSELDSDEPVLSAFSVATGNPIAKKLPRDKIQLTNDKPTTIAENGSDAERDTGITDTNGNNEESSQGIDSNLTNPANAAFQSTENINGSQKSTNEKRSLPTQEQERPLLNEDAPVIGASTNQEKKVSNNAKNKPITISESGNNAATQEGNAAPKGESKASEVYNLPTEGIENVTDNPILTAKKTTWVKNRLKELGVKEGSPGYVKRLKEVQDEHAVELEKAQASLPYERFKALPDNSTSTDNLVRQSYDGLREQYGITTPIDTQTHEAATLSNIDKKASDDEIIKNAVENSNRLGLTGKERRASIHEDIAQAFGMTKDEVLDIPEAKKAILSKPSKESNTISANRAVDDVVKRAMAAHAEEASNQSSKPHDDFMIHRYDIIKELENRGHVNKLLKHAGVKSLGALDDLRAIDQENAYEKYVKDGNEPVKINESYNDKVRRTEKEASDKLNNAKTEKQSQQEPTNEKQIRESIDEANDNLPDGYEIKDDGKSLSLWNKGVITGHTGLSRLNGAKELLRITRIQHDRDKQWVDKKSPIEEEQNPIAPKTAEYIQAQKKAEQALSDLGVIFLDANLFANKAVPVKLDGARLLPVLSRLMSAYIEMGYINFKENAIAVLAVIREKFGDAAADSLSMANLRAAYNNTEQGATPEEEVIKFKTFGQLEKDYVKSELSQPENSNDHSKENNSGTKGNVSNDSSEAPNQSGVSDQQSQKHNKRGVSDSEKGVQAGSNQSNEADSSKSQGDELSRNEGLAGHGTNGSDQQAIKQHDSKDGSLSSDIGADNYSLINKKPIELTPAKRRDINILAETILKKPVNEITEDDKNILRQYTGNGGLDLKASEDKGAGIFNQHYTAYDTIKAIYGALMDAGIKMINNLEPSVGSGNFIGMHPRSNWTAVDIDKVNTEIVERLYPDAKVFNESYETFRGKNFDLIISNVPFASFSSLAREHAGTIKPAFKAIHNFFFAQSVDKLKVGGVMAFMTSTSTMDGLGEGQRLREHLVKEMDVIGAFRLPMGTQKANASTEVMIDVIFLQKRQEGVASKQPEKNQAFVNLTTKDGHKINQYFVDYPDSVLGDLSIGKNNTSMGKVGWIVTGKADYSKMVIEPQSYVSNTKDEQKTFKDQDEAQTYADKKGLKFVDKKTNPFFKDGIIYDSPVSYSDVSGGGLFGHKATGVNADKLALLQKIDETHNEELVHDYENKYGKPPHTDKTLISWAKAHYAEQQLKAYLALFDKHFNVSEIFTKKVRFEDSGKIEVDEHSPLFERAESLEDAEGIFSPKTSSLISTEEVQGLLDSNHYARLANGSLQNARLYYAGNIYKKLEDAAKVRPAAQREKQIARLERVKQKSIEIKNLTITGKESWLPDSAIASIGKKTYSDGVVIIGENAISDNHLLHLFNQYINNQELVKKGKDDTPEEYAAILKAAQNTLHQEVIPLIKQKLLDDGLADEVVDSYNKAKNFFAPPIFDGSSLRNLPTTFRGKKFTLMKHQQEGAERAIYNKKGVLAFSPGLGKTPTAIIVADQLLQKGVMKKPLFIVPANTIPQWEATTRELYPNAKIYEFPKYASGINKGKPKEWQSMTAADKEKMAYDLTNNRYDFTFISTNLAQKFTIPTAKLSQYLDDLTESISGMENPDELLNKAQIKAKETRLAKIAMLKNTMMAAYEESTKMGFDMGKMGFDALFADEVQYYKNIGMQSEDAKGGIGANVAISEKYPVDAEGKPDKKKNPISVTLGSSRSYYFRFKTQFISESNNGNNVFLLTGTPTPNKPLELMTLLHHLDTHILDEYGINNVGEFIDEFLDVQEVEEMGVDGANKMKAQLVGIKNIFGLKKIITRFIDYRSPESASDLVRPKQIDKTHIILQNEDAESIFSDIQKRILQGIEDAQEKKNGNKDVIVEPIISMYTAGRDASVDVRLYTPSANGKGDIQYGTVFQKETRAEYSKISKTVELVAAKIALYENKEFVPGYGFMIPYKKGMEGLTNQEPELIDGYGWMLPMLKHESGQLIFLDRLKFSDGSGSTHEDIRNDILKATRLDPKQVVFVNGGEYVNPNTGKIARSIKPEMLQSIMDKYNSGDIKVLIGNTSKLGVGVDLQVTTTDIYQIDKPYRPDEIEQRNNRGVRQGNRNAEVTVHTFNQPGTFDAMSDRIIATKQGFNDVFWKDQETDTADVKGEEAPGHYDAAIELERDPVRKRKLEIERDLNQASAKSNNLEKQVSTLAKRIRSSSENKAQYENANKGIDTRETPKYEDQTDAERKKSVAAWKKRQADQRALNVQRIGDITNDLIDLEAHKAERMQELEAHKTYIADIRSQYVVNGVVSLEAIRNSGNNNSIHNDIRYSKNDLVTNPHTQSSLTQAIKSFMDKAFGNGWTDRLMSTGKFKVISRDESAKLIGGGELFAKVGDRSAANTQIDTTMGAYAAVARNLLLKIPNVKNVLDYGAGKGRGTASIFRALSNNGIHANVKSYEPFPENWAKTLTDKPDFTDADNIKDSSQDAVVNLNVLNVVPKEIRDDIVKNIGRVLKDGGVAVISSRRWKGDVDTIKPANSTLGEEPNSFYVTRKLKGEIQTNYQKGIEPDELVAYIKKLLPNFDVRKINGYGASAVIIQKNGGDQILDSILKAQKNNNVGSGSESTASLRKQSKDLGSGDRYSAFGVGKKMGDELYLHSDYENVIPKGDLQDAKSRIGNFKYNLIRYNTKTGSIGFFNSPDFDTAQEPVNGDLRVVEPDGTVRDVSLNSDPNKQAIYHHKWQWVNDDYKGFDVKSSIERSIKWQKIVNKNNIDRKRIGFQGVWRNEVLNPFELKYSKEGHVVAFYNPKDGTTYFVHDNITKDMSDEQLKGLMLHEIAVHALQLGKSSAEFKAILARFEKLKAIDPKIKAAFDRVPSDTNPELVTEEALGYYLEKYPKSTLSKRVIEWFRQAIRAIGNTLVGKDKYLFSKWANELTHAELVGMATNALKSSPDSLIFDKAERDLNETPLDLNKIGFNLENNDILFSKSEPKIGENYTLPSETKPRHQQRLWQDMNNRWNVIQDVIKKAGGMITDSNNVYQAMELMPSKAGERIRDYRDTYITPLYDRMTKAGVTLNDLALFNYATHAEERNLAMSKINPRFASDNGSGMTNQEAIDTLDELKIHYGSRFGEFEKIAKEFRAITDDTLNVLVDAGVMTQDAVNKMRATYQNYVPLKGFEKVDESGNQTNSTGLGFSTRRSFSKRALGRESKAGQIIENIIRDHERAIIWAEKTEVAKTLGNFVHDFPDDKLWTLQKIPLKPTLMPGKREFFLFYNGSFVGKSKTAKDMRRFRDAEIARTGQDKKDYRINVIKADDKVGATPESFNPEKEARYIQDGKEVRIQIHDPLALKAFNKLGDQSDNEIFILAGTMNSFLRQMWTQKNPSFFLINPIRDVQTASIYLTGEGGISLAGKALKNWSSSWFTMWNHARNKQSSPSEQAMLDRYRKSGGMVGTAYISSLDKINEDIHHQLQLFGGEQIQDLISAGKIREAARSIGFRVLNNKLFDGIEALNMAFECATRLATFKAAVESGYTDKQAAALALNVTVNFTKKGEYGRELGAMYLFANANIQGNANVFKTLTQSNYRGQAWAIAGSLVALGFMAAMAGGDDGEDELISDYEKERNLIFDLGEGKRFDIPVAYGWSIFMDMGRAVARSMNGGDTEAISKKLASSFLGNFSPIGNPIPNGELSADNAIVAFAPTFSKPFVMPAVNKTSFGTPLMPESPFKPNQPDSEKVYRKTRGTIYDMVADTLNSVTGGDAVQSGWIDVSPETLKNTWNYLLGGAGRFITDTESMAQTALSVNEESKPESWPIVKTFYKAESIDDYRRRYYEQADRIAKANEQFNAYKKSGEIDKAKEMIRDNGNLIRLKDYSNGVRDKIKAIRNREDEIRKEGGDISLLNALENRERKILSDFSITASS